MSKTVLLYNAKTKELKPFNIKTETETSRDIDLHAMYEALNCDTVECRRIFRNKYLIWFDEEFLCHEGRYKKEDVASMILPETMEPIFGNFLVVKNKEPECGSLDDDDILLLRLAIEKLQKTLREQNITYGMVSGSLSY